MVEQIEVAIVYRRQVEFLLVCHRLLFLVYDYLREVKGSIVVCISPLTALTMEQKTKYTHQGLSLAANCSMIYRVSATYGRE